MAGERTFVVKFVSDVKDALKGMTQMNNSFVRFSSNVEGRVMASLKDLIPSFKQIAAVGVGSFAGLAAAAYKFTEAASQDQKAQALLVNQIKEVTFANTAQIDSLGAYIDKLQMASGVADDQLRPALANLVRGTGSLTEAQKLLSLTLDISAGSGKGVEEVSLALAKAAGGQTTALTRLGIPLDENAKKTKDFDAITAQLSDTFKGASTTAANTFEGGMARLKIGLGEVGESIGYILLPYAERFVTFVNDNIVPALKIFVDNLEEKGIRGALELAIASMGDFGLTFVEGMKGAYIAVLTVVKEMATFVRQIAFAGGVASALGRNVGGYFKALGVVIASENIEKRVDKALGNADQLFDNLATSILNAREQLWLMSRPTQDISDAFERSAIKGKIFKVAVKDIKDEIDPPSGGGLKQTLETAAEKIKKYGDAIKNTTSLQKSFTSAQKQSKDASKSLTQANTDLATAQENFNKAVAGYGAGSAEANKAQRDLDAAQRNLARAGFRVEESVFAVAKAEEDLAKIRLDPQSTPTAIREAEIALAEAKLSVADAADEQLAAQDGLATATNDYRIIVEGANEQDQIFKDLKKSLADATERQADMQLRYNEALEAEAEARNNVVDSIRNLQGAYAGVIGRAGIVPFDVSLTQIPSLTTATGSTTGNMAGAGQVNITVNAGLGASGQEIGAEIAEYLGQYATLSGFEYGKNGALFGR